jgi:hypothetical protein
MSAPADSLSTRAASLLRIGGGKKEDHTAFHNCCLPSAILQRAPSVMSLSYENCCAIALMDIVVGNGRLQTDGQSKIFE